MAFQEVPSVAGVVSEAESPIATPMAEAEGSIAAPKAMPKAETCIPTAKASIVAAPQATPKAEASISIAKASIATTPMVEPPIATAEALPIVAEPKAEMPTIAKPMAMPPVVAAPEAATAEMPEPNQEPGDAPAAAAPAEMPVPCCPWQFAVVIDESTLVPVYIADVHEPTAEAIASLWRRSLKWSNAERVKAIITTGQSQPLLWAAFLRLERSLNGLESSARKRRVTAASRTEDRRQAQLAKRTRANAESFAAVASGGNGAASSADPVGSVHAKAAPPKAKAIAVAAKNMAAAPAPKAAVPKAALPKAVVPKAVVSKAKAAGSKAEAAVSKALPK